MTKLIYPYQQVRRFVQDQIDMGIWKVGKLIPSEIKLAEQLAVHRLTVNRVLTEFARDGVFVRRRGVGTMLVDRKKPPLKPRAGQGLVGLITGHHFDPITNPFYGAIFERLRKLLKAQGIYLIPLGDATEYFENKASPASRGEDLSALAMLGVPDSERTMSLLEGGEVPTVIIGVSEYHGPLPHIAADDEADAELIARRILGLGHRQIVHLNAIPPKRMRSRLHGFLRGCEQEGHALPFRYIVEARGLEMRDGKEAMLEFLKLGLPFTAVFGGIDNLALGAMSALAESGIAIPEQVSVVGFDGIDAALHSVPPLATMRVSRSCLADRAADCLVSLCSGRAMGPEKKPLRSRWLEGGTLGPPPAQAFPLTERSAAAKEST
ncbi:MAG: GntR family transcriptional regulator [Verrucomicrobiae bacterium]